MMRKIWNILRNKYLITTVAFLLLMLFFDNNNVYYLRELIERRDELQRDKAWYEQEIKDSERQLLELSSDIEQLEKFGREKYYMKRENEDVFVIIPEKESTPN